MGRLVEMRVLDVQKQYVFPTPPGKPAVSYLADFLSVEPEPTRYLVQIPEHMIGGLGVACQTGAVVQVDIEDWANGWEDVQ